MTKFGTWQTQLLDAAPLKIEQLSSVKVRLILFLMVADLERVLVAIGNRNLMIPNFIENVYPDIYNANIVLSFSIVEVSPV